MEDEGGALMEGQMANALGTVVEEGMLDDIQDNGMVDSGNLDNGMNQP